MHARVRTGAAQWIGRACAVVTLTLGCAATPARAADQPGGQPPLGLPDTFGGYPTTHILIRLAPGLTPVQAQGVGVSIDAGPIDLLCQAWGVTGIEPVFSAAPRNAALAETYGLLRWYRLMVPAGTQTPTMVAEFTGVPGVEVVELDGSGGGGYQRAGCVGVVHRQCGPDARGH